MSQRDSGRQGPQHRYGGFDSGVCVGGRYFCLLTVQAGILSVEIKHSLAPLEAQKKLNCLRAEEGLQRDCKIGCDRGASVSKSVLKGRE